MKSKMTEVEQKLVKLLRNSLSGDLIVGIEEFEKYYWALSDELLNWNSELGKTIHDFAESLEYFEKSEEQRDHHSLFGSEELVKKIESVLIIANKH